MKFWKEISSTNPIPLMVLLTSISLFMNNSCKTYNFNDEIRQVDTLISWAERATNTLVIDQSHIQNRMDSMVKKIGFIEDLDKDKMSNEFVMDFIQYKALYDNYKEFLSSYSVLTFDNDSYSKDLKELKQRLINKSITKEEFTSYYQTQRDGIKTNLEQSKKTVRKLVSQENMYQRINGKITKFIDGFETN